MQLRFLSVLAALCLCAGLHAQPALGIGASLPAIQVTDIDGRPLTIGGAGSGPLLIDFFATWCGPCIQALPVLDSLARQLGPPLGMVLVSAEAPQKLAALRQRYPAIARGPLRWVAADTLLRQYFPHRLIPHQVWLAPGGRVAAITGHAAVGPDALAKLMRGEALQLPLKADLADYDRRRSILSYLPGWAAGAIRYGSYFTALLPGAPGGTGLVKMAGSQRLYFTNLPLSWMYRQAFQLGSDFVVRSTAGPLPAVYHPDSLYCYELLAPPGTSQASMHARLSADLEWFSGHQARRQPGSRGSPDTLWLSPLAGPKPLRQQR